MDGAAQQVIQRVTLAHAQHAKSARAAGLLGVLLALLLWETRWPSLRLGLIVLLMGQLAAMAMLMRRNARNANDLKRLRTGGMVESELLSWFDEEERVAGQLTVVETSTRLVGFLMLAYGFWQATGSVAIALLLGVFYPVIAYFGIVRKNHVRMIKKLQAQKSQVQEALLSAEQN